MLLVLLMAGGLLFAGCGKKTTLGALQAKSAKVRNCLLTVSRGKLEGQTVTALVSFQNGNYNKFKEIRPYGYQIMDMDTLIRSEFIERDNVIRTSPIYQGTIDLRLMGNPYDYSTVVTPKTEITKMEYVDGVKCWVLTYTNPAQKNSQKTFYIDDEYGLLRQMTIGKMTTRWSYLWINNIPDSEFTLPAGVPTVPIPGSPPILPR